MSKEPILLAENVKRSFRDGTNVIEVLQGVNLRVEAGELIAIVGASGSGKTTLLNILSVLDSPDDGSVKIQGREVTGLKDDDLTMIRRHEVGMVFQDFYLLPTLSAIENVEVPMIFADVAEKKRKDRAYELLEIVDMTSHAHHRPDELSGGQKQRVAIARAIANDPAILYADEPTGNLDTAKGQEILDLFASIKKMQDKAIVMVTHDPEAATRADRVLLLRDGVVSQEISAESLVI
ncbi:MAG: ABC transporter ATP-binding protein [Candidatus Heimdallarchaeota archaeon]